MSTIAITPLQAYFITTSDTHNMGGSLPSELAIQESLRSSTRVTPSVTGTMDEPSPSKLPIQGSPRSSPGGTKKTSTSNHPTQQLTSSNTNAKKRTSISILSPLGQRAAWIYKLAIFLGHHLKSLLEPSAEEQKAKKVWAEVVSKFRKDIKNKGCCLHALKADTAELQEQVLALLRGGFESRYGPIVDVVCQALQVPVPESKFPDFKYSKNIMDGLMQETDSLRFRNLENKEIEDDPWDEDRPLFDNLVKVKLSTGLDMEGIIQHIFHYARHDDYADADLADFLREGRFEDLKRRLYHDFHDLAKIIPAAEYEYTDIMSTAIASLIQRWFDPVSKGDADDLSSWTQMPALGLLHTKLQDGAVGLEDGVDLLGELYSDAADNALGCIHKDRDKEYMRQGGPLLSDVIPVGAAERALAQYQNLFAMAGREKKISQTFDPIFGMLVGRGLV